MNIPVWTATFVEETDVAPDAGMPSKQQRLTIAFAIGVVAGLFSWMMQQRAGATPDFAYVHTAARFFLNGENPYHVMEGPPGSRAPFDQPLFYPFTTLLLAVPFTAFSIAIGTGLFIGISAAALAYCITKDGMWRLHVFASAPFVLAATVGQFSPLLSVMALVPALGFLAAVKPNLGLALFVRRPSLSMVVGSVLLLAISIAVFPSWPTDWLESLRRSVTDDTHRAPILQAGGFLLLLSVIAWRRAAGRLLLTLSLVPQALLFYDQLLLWLIPRTKNQSIVLTGFSQLGMVAWYLSLGPDENPIPAAYPFVVPFIFLPALGIVLWQEWLKRAEARLPAGVEPAYRPSGVAE